MISEIDEVQISDPSRRMLSIAQVADQLGVSQGCVYNLVQTQKLKAYRIGIRGGRVKIRQADVDAYLNASCTVGNSPPVSVAPKTQRLETLRPRKIQPRKKARAK